MRGERAEALAILGQVDCLVRSPEDPIAGVLDVARQAERGLAAELGDDAEWLLAVADGQDFLWGKRLEVQAIGRVVVRGDGLRVAVDHHGLVAQLAEGLRCVDAAVVELDPLADAIGAGAQDHDAWPVTSWKRLVLLSPGRVEVVRAGLDLAGAGVDATEGRTHAALVTKPAYFRAGETKGFADRVVAPPRAFRPEQIAAHELGSRAIELCAEPGMKPFRKLVEARPGSRSLALELPRPVRLEKRLGERAPDSHRLAHRLHLRAERLIGAGELLEGEARKLDHDVVERRLEARGGRLGEVVGDLVERVTDRELGGHLGDRVAGRLGRERRGTRDPRVHLDHAQRPRLAGARELDVRAPRFDADRADDCGCRVSEVLVGP